MQIRSSLLAAAFGLSFALSPAAAQVDNYEGATSGGPNEVVVITPHFHARTSPLNAPPEDASMSESVHYGDLDLRTWQGARELRTRVRLAAESVCARLREVYPYPLNPHKRCYWDALDSAMPKADSAIADARWPYNYRYDAAYDGYPR